MAFTFKHGDRPLDGYQIQRGVGRGGFGEVYYAVSDGGREVALKYLRENPEIELRGIAQCINLKSPHLVSIFDVRQNAEGEYFVIMEYVSGPSLRDMLIAEPNGLGTQKAAFFTREIAKGLSYLHDRGIVHRDLKPGNIFYEDGYVKICDYGLSKFISVSRHSAQTSSVGTVHYMAPEVGSGNYSKTIDIYALGVILYEMLLGRVPYEGASMGEILMKHLTQQPEVDALPAPFGAVIRKALAKEPADRFQDVGSMVEVLFGVDDVRRSVLGFEPSSLTMVANRAARDVRPSPVPSDHALPNAVRHHRPRTAPGGDHFSRRFVERTAGLDVRLTRRERRQARKRRRNTPPPAPELLGKPEDDPDVVRSEYCITAGQRAGRVLVGLVVATFLGLGIGMISKDYGIGGVSIGIIMSGVVGIGIGHRLAHWLGPDRPWFIDRLLVVAFAAPAAAIVMGALHGGHMVCDAFDHPGSTENLHLAFLAGLILVDWQARIRNGQQGDFGWWEAFVAALVTFVASKILCGQASDESHYLLAGLAASISITLETFAWALIRNPRSEPAEPAPVRQPVESHRGRGRHGRRAEAAGPTVAPPSPAITAQAPVAETPRRGWAARVTAWLAVLASSGLVLLLAGLAISGEFRGEEEWFGAAVGTAAALSMARFAHGKTRPMLREQGAWRSWANPLLEVAANTGIAAGAAGLMIFDDVDGGGLAALIVCLVCSAVLKVSLRHNRRPRPEPRFREALGGGGRRTDEPYGSERRMQAQPADLPPGALEGFLISEKNRRN